MPAGEVIRTRVPWLARSASKPARAQWYAPRSDTAACSSHNDRSTSSRRCGSLERLLVALCTIACSAPLRATARSTASAMVDSSVTSQRTQSARPPRASISRTTSWPSTVRVPTITSAPAAAHANAIPRPTPAPAPVTITLRPASRPVTVPSPSPPSTITVDPVIPPALGATKRAMAAATSSRRSGSRPTTGGASNVVASTSSGATSAGGTSTDELGVAGIHHPDVLATDVGGRLDLADNDTGAGGCRGAQLSLELREVHVVAVSCPRQCRQEGTPGRDGEGSVAQGRAAQGIWQQG